MKRGLLIALEGGDRCGKTTQVQHLLDSREGSVKFKFPTMVPSASSFDWERYQKEFEANPTVERAIQLGLAFSADRRAASYLIEQNLREGHDVVLDRFWLSGVVYSYARLIEYFISIPNFDGATYLPCLLRHLLNFEAGLMVPDYCFVLYNPSKDGNTKRAGFGSGYNEEAKFQRRINHIYENVVRWLMDFDVLPGVHTRVYNCHSLDEEEVWESIEDAIKDDNTPLDITVVPYCKAIVPKLAQKMDYWRLKCPGTKAATSCEFCRKGLEELANDSDSSYSPCATKRSLSSTSESEDVCKKSKDD